MRVERPQSQNRNHMPPTMPGQVYAGKETESRTAPLGEVFVFARYTFANISHFHSLVDRVRSIIIFVLLTPRGHFFDTK